MTTKTLKTAMRPAIHCLTDLFSDRITENSLGFSLAMFELGIAGNTCVRRFLNLLVMKEI